MFGRRRLLFDHACTSKLLLRKNLGKPLVEFGWSARDACGAHDKRTTSWAFFSGAHSLFPPPHRDICYISVSISHAPAFHVLYLIRSSCIFMLYELLFVYPWARLIIKITMNANIDIVRFVVK